MNARFSLLDLDLERPFAISFRTTSHVSDISKHLPRTVRWTTKGTRLLFSKTWLPGGCDWRWTLGVSAALLLSLTWCRADNTPVGTTRADRNRAGSRQNRLLLMVSGRIIEGKISQSVGGYLVEMPTGSMLVPFEHVRLEAADRRDAYRKLRKMLPERTATRHIALARWCLSQNLLDEAHIELRDALELEPNRSDARSMLRRLEESLHKGNSIHRVLPKTPLKTFDGFEPPEVRSLAGLSRGSAQQFVSKIQPILMNKCATAGCHGPAARNKFRLTRVHVGWGSHRVFSERNLAAVLRYLDVNKPGQSPLLVIPQGGHGRGSRAIFYGSGGADQMAALGRWVRQVAGERAAKTKMRSAECGKIKVTPFSTRNPQPSTRNSQLSTLGPQQTPSEKDDLLNRILREERKDAFDPRVFNRLVHGKKGEDK